MSATLLSAWLRTVGTAPDAVALIDAATDRTWRRDELDVLADGWCTAYGANASGQTVLLAEANGAGWLTVFLGLLKANAVVAALDPGEPPVAQRAIAKAIRAPLLWSAGKLHELGPRRPAPRDGRRLLKLTSGSTGAPRAIAFTDAQMLADGRQVCTSMGIAPADVNLGLIPFGHSYGLGNLVMPLLMQGTAIVCGAPALPHAIAEIVARERPTVFPAVPALLGALAASDVSPVQLQSLRTIISAGAPLSAEVAEAFYAKFGKKIHSFYGSSETGGIAYDRGGDAARAGRSVGTPLDGVRLDFGRGERFAVESAAVFTIGNRRGAASGRRGRHRPADFGRLNDRGELVLLGRTGQFVKIAGRRLNLAEIEHALKKLTGISDALVVLHSGRAEALAAAVVSERTAAEIREELREQLAVWKIPKRLVVLPEFPVTARGKTDAARLRALLE
jgi:long-chain acyl-CoA synthetase